MTFNNLNKNLSKSGSLQEKFIKVSEEDNENIPQYDPYKIPPDLDLAINHAKAKRVSKQNPLEFSKLCPCCNMLVDNRQFKMSCRLDDLAFLGCAYPFYFYFIKQVLLILCMLLFLGGSIKLFIINQDCNEKCVTFFGFGILNLKPSKLNYQIGGQSWMDTLISLLMIVFTLYAKNKCFKTMKKYNEEAINPANYTLMVQNFPKDTTSQEIEAYFEGLTKSKIFTINLAYNINEYKSSFKKKLKLVTKIHEILKQPHKTPESQADLGRLLLERTRIDIKLEEFISSCEQEDPPSQSFVIKSFGKTKNTPKEFTGTAFITFNDQAPIKVLIDSWGVTYFRTMKFLFFGDSFKMNPYLKYKTNTLLLHHAPDPSDVIWENLDFSFWRNFHNNIIMYFLAGLLLFVSFRIQFETIKVVIGLKNDLLASEKMKSDEINTLTLNNFIIKTSAFAISSIILLINYFLRLIVYFFTYAQRHYSVSRFNEYYLHVYILLMFFNSALMPYLVNTFLNNETTPEQLLWDIHFILLTNAFSPIFKLLDPFLWYRKYQQKRIMAMGENCTMPQLIVNSWFEGHPIDMAENYAFVVRTLLLGSWYAAIAPLGLIFSMIGLGFSYWLDKYFLLRVHSYPMSQNESIIYRFVNNLEILPYLYIFGATEYQYRLIQSQELMDFLWGFLVYGVTSGAMTVCLLIYYVFFKKKWMSKNPSELKYEDARFLFLGDFERCNPLTQAEASQRFLKEIENARQLSPIQRKHLMKAATMSIRNSHDRMKTLMGLKRKPSIGMPGMFEDGGVKEFELDEMK